MTSDIWDADTAATYDEDSAEQFRAEVVGPAVDLLAKLAGSGRAQRLTECLWPRRIRESAEPVAAAWSDIDAPARD